MSILPFLAGPTQRPYATPILVTSGQNGSSSTSATTYATFSNSVAFDSSETNNSVRMPMACAVNDLRVVLATAPGSGKSWTITLRVNNANTSLSTVISDLNTSGTATGAVSVAAGDTVTWSLVPAGTPAALTSGISISCVLTATSGGQTAMFGGNSSTMGATAAARYCGLANGVWDATEANSSVIVPVSGRFRRLHVNLNGGPGSGTSYTFTLYKNGSSTDLAATISGTSTTGEDTADFVAVAAGDTVSLQASPTGAVLDRNCRFSLVFEPDQPGYSFTCARLASPSTTVDNYGRWGLQSASPGTSATDVLKGVSPGAFTVSRFYVALQAAPSSGKSRVSYLYRNGSNSALTTTIADSATSASDLTNSVAISAGDTLFLKTTPSGTPSATTYLKGSLVFYTT